MVLLSLRSLVLLKFGHIHVSYRSLAIGCTVRHLLLLNMGPTTELTG